MADGVFTTAKGAMAEMIRDDATKVGVLLMKAAEADTLLVDHLDVAALLVPAANTEADFTNYARKTPITGVRTQDDGNERVDLDIPDQTFSNAGGASNNTLVKLVVFYENAAADATRIPLTHHDFAVTTDGSDLTAQVDAAGFGRAA